MIEELLGGSTGGRHALDEDAVQTPIFAALTRGGWRRRQQERTAASFEEFRRDPLTAPIPIQLVGAAAPVTGRSASPARQRSGGAAGAHASVTGSVIADMTVRAGAGSTRRSGPAVERTRTSRPRAAASVPPRRQRAASAEPRDWAGLAALAECGRHHLRPLAANW